MISFRCRRARYTSALKTIITRDARIILSELRMCTYTRTSSEKDKITIYRLIVSNDSLRERTLNTIRYRRYTRAALISNTTRVIKNVITNNNNITIPTCLIFFLPLECGRSAENVRIVYLQCTDGRKSKNNNSCIERKKNYHYYYYYDRRGRGYRRTEFQKCSSECV